MRDEELHDLAEDFASTSEPDEFAELFASLDTVTASDSLKTRTLDAIFAKAEASTKAPESAPATSEGADAPAPTSEKPLSAPLADANETPRLQGRRARRGKRSILHVLRVPLTALCIVLALGGVAYATPVSHATITQDDTTIVLDVNLFGLTINAHANDDMGRQAIASVQLTNRPFEESLDQACTVLENLDHQRPLEISVEAQLDGQRKRMETESARVRAEHEPADQANPSADATSQSTSPDSRQDVSGQKDAGVQEGGEPDTGGQSQDSARPSGDGTGASTGESQPGAPEELSGLSPSNEGGPDFDTKPQGTQAQQGDQQPQTEAPNDGGIQEGPGQQGAERSPDGQG